MDLHLCVSGWDNLCHSCGSVCARTRVRRCARGCAWVRGHVGGGAGGKERAGIRGGVRGGAVCAGACARVRVRLRVGLHDGGCVCEAYLTLSGGQDTVPFGLGFRLRFRDILAVLFARRSAWPHMAT